MPDLTSSEQSAKEYAEKVNPNVSTRLEKIGKTIAMIYEGIPLTKKQQTILFDEVSLEKPPTFDYIDIDTKSLIHEAADNEDSIKKAFDFYKKRELIKDGVFVAGPSPYIGLNFEEFRDVVKKERIEAGKNMTSSFAGAQLRPNHQDQAIKDSLFTLFGTHTHEDSQKFFDVVKASPNKPFLILNGHGGSRKSFFQKKWIIGEAEGNSDDLSVVFDKIDAEKYSAILLLSCNPDRLKPPKLHGPVVFYGDSSIGLRQLLSEEGQRRAKHT